MSTRVIDRCALASVLALAGCVSPGPSRNELGVQLVTDFRAGREFAAVEVEVQGAPSVVRTAVDGALDYTRPQRIADVGGLTARDERTVTVRLLDAAERVVIARTLRVTARGSATRTVVVSRRCLDVRCNAGESCLGGLCLADTCESRAAPGCDVEPLCERDADCGACGDARCALGVCLESGALDCPADAGAGDGATGDGSADAGPVDAGGDPSDSPLDCGAVPCSLDINCSRHRYGMRTVWLCRLPANFETARANCERDGAALLLPRDADENAFLAGLIQASISKGPVREGPHYLGAQDEITEGVWTDLNGTELTFQPWEPDAPNNEVDNQCGSENCATMFANGNWNDRCCTGQYPYLCAFDPEP